MKQQQGIRILIVEDHSAVRIGMKHMLHEIVSMPHISMANNLDNALESLLTDTFDLVILDLNMPGGKSPAVVRKVHERRKNAHILVFSAYNEQVYALPCLQAGADGYLSKTAPDEEFSNAVHSVLSGKKYLSEEMQQQAILKIAATSGNAAHTGGTGILSARETEVMQLLLKGMGTAEIAAKVHLQLSTISTYKMKIFEKMRVKNIVELVEKMKIYGE